tara:strand:- start:2179 stop:2586 length:408 start_codon:yes stop_codon:yes gene_type:complete
MRVITEIPFLNMLMKKNPLTIEIEDRVSLKRNTYKMNNHAEFIDYHNPHDNCYWDAVIPGYNKKFKGTDKFNTSKIIGVYVLDNGNHKVAVQINSAPKGYIYSEKKAITDMKRYITTYKKKIPVSGKWILLDGFN